jgi:hypothetical protein
MNDTSRLRIRIGAVITLVAALGAIGIAQQSIYKAPTPADWTALSKLPDFSGVWERGGGGGGGGQRANQNAAPAAPAGAGGGQRAGGGRGGPSFTAKYEALRAAAAKAPQPEDSETANCLPPGMPGIMGQPYPMEFLLTPGKVTIVIEAYTQVRHIYTDGRPLPPDPNPKFFGTSIGRWEGDTLVVETIGFNDFVQLARGVPHSDKMKIVERFRLTDPDTMSIETTISDSEALQAPYTTTATLRRHRDWTISEYVCEENNRNSVDQSGKAGIDLTPPAQKKE